MCMIKFSYRKGVYMLVSAISLSSCNTVFNTRINSRGGDNSAGTAQINSDSFVSNTKENDRKKLFDSINEWKYFCHEQIKKGNFDVIV